MRSGRMAFNVQRLAFNVQRLAFGVWRLAFGVWRLAFQVCSSGKMLEAKRETLPAECSASHSASGLAPRLPPNAKRQRQTLNVERKKFDTELARV